LAQLAAQAHTSPSSIGGEKAFNPFMRAVMAVTAVLAHCGTDNPVAAVKFVREEKSAGTWRKASPAL
jgi:hypothetical protein